MAIQDIEFYVEGMTCTSCEKIISKNIKKLKGVRSADVDYASGKVSVTYNDKLNSLDDIFDKVEEKGYELKENKRIDKNLLGWAFGIIGVIIAAYFLFGLVEGIAFPEISLGMGYGLLFLVGLLTGFHCIAMCGGFVVSYTASDAKSGKKSYISHLMYGGGKTISYTIIGAFFGLLGSIIAFTPKMRGVAGILAGLFLILFGIKMLNLFPSLRRLNIRTPKLIGKFVDRNSKKASSPLIIGLLNGLMIACGPLQAIYVMAAGTGSMIEGAKLLFIFGIGTLPVMIGFGYFATFVSSKMTIKIVKTSGIIVMILGIIMMNNGLALAGTGFDFNTMKTKIIEVNAIDEVQNLPDNVAVMNGDYQEIHMKVTRYGWEPDKFILKKDVPVRWIIDGEEINGCNNAIQVPKYNLKFDIKPGEQVIEFTPTEAGIVPWSCWMGMIPGTFIIKENISNINEIKKDLSAATAAPSGSTCGASGGGCGCGMR